MSGCQRQSERSHFRITLPLKNNLTAVANLYGEKK